jgi:hypothetical protein
MEWQNSTEATELYNEEIAQMVEEHGITHREARLRYPEIEFLAAWKPDIDRNRLIVNTEINYPEQQNHRVLEHALADYAMENFVYRYGSEFKYYRQIIYRTQWKPIDHLSSLYEDQKNWPNIRIKN